MKSTQIAQSILITGCSSGIGYCAAQVLTERGYRVFAAARHHADVQRLAEEGFEALQLDLDDSASINRAVAQVLERTNGTLDALFNNAAYGQPGAVEDLNRDVLRMQFETNFFGTVELTNRVIPVMRRQGYGRIIQNSSVLGLAALPYRGAYNATKFALEGLTDTLRLELTDSGIIVALIEPGPIKSRFRENALAAYRRNISVVQSAHREKYEALEHRLTRQGETSQFTMQPQAVVAKLIHALESPRPKIRYYVTFPTYFFAALRRLVTHRFLDRILRRVSDAEQKH